MYLRVFGYLRSAFVLYAVVFILCAGESDIFYAFVKVSFFMPLWIWHGCEQKKKKKKKTPANAALLILVSGLHMQLGTALPGYLVFFA